MGSGVKPKPKMAKGGSQATTSHQSTVWRNIPGTTGPCPATQLSTCWAAGSTAASWSGRARAVLARGPSRWDTKGGCTTTESTLLPMARYGAQAGGAAGLGVLTFGQEDPGLLTLGLRSYHKSQTGRCLKAASSGRRRRHCSVSLGKTLCWGPVTWCYKSRGLVWLSACPAGVLLLAVTRQEFLLRFGTYFLN